MRLEAEGKRGAAAPPLGRADDVVIYLSRAPCEGSPAHLYAE